MSWNIQIFNMESSKLSDSFDKRVSKLLLNYGTFK